MVFNQIIDLFIYLCQKRGKSDKKMESCETNVEEGNHNITLMKDKITSSNCKTQICTTVQRVRKISQCSVELHCLEEPKVVANEIFGPDNSTVLTLIHENSTKPNNSRRHSVDVLGGISARYPDI